MSNKVRKVVTYRPRRSVAWLIFVVAVVLLSILMLRLYGIYTQAHIQQSARQRALESATIDTFYSVTIPGSQTNIVVSPLQAYENPVDEWFLVNKIKNLNTAYVPQSLTKLSLPVAPNADAPVMYMQAAATPPLVAMFSAADAAGVPLVVRSAYRSSDAQKALYDSVPAWRIEFVAVPGQSEHQTGWAVDVNSKAPNCSSCSIDPATAAWVKANAHLYGYVVRYEEGKEAITGYPAESWHLRYVGKQLAKKMHQTGKTLEEIHALLKN